MHLFKPTIMLKKVTDITVSLIDELNIDSILLDVDNTLTGHGSQEPFEGTIKWAKSMQDKGVNIVIVSNNFKTRVAPFAKKFKLPFVSLSLKPLPVGFNKAKKILNNNAKNVLVVGDQIFTDIVGANLAGMKSVLLEPLFKDKTLGTIIKRKMEVPIRKKLKDEVVLKK